MTETVRLLSISTEQLDQMRFLPPVAQILLRATSLSKDQLDQMRWGTFGPWRGVDVIGFYGLARMFGYRKRNGDPAWETVRSQHSLVPGFPAPAFVVVLDGRRYYLFDAAVMRRWGQQTHRLNPDGSPRRLRPVRGKARPKPT